MTHPKRQKTISKFLIGAYCVLCGIVLIGILYLTPNPLPQVSEILLEGSGKALIIKGQHLDQRMDAVLVPSYDKDEAIITKRSTWGEAHDVRILNGTAWVSNSTKGIVGFNIDDPEHPYAVSSLDLPEKVRFWRLEVTQHFLLITAPRKGFYIVDVKDPKNPQLLSHLHLNGITQQIVVKENLALIAAGNKGLHVIDIENKRKPIHLSTLDLDSYIQSIACIDNLALLSGGKGKGPGVTYFVDISTPTQPKQIEKLSFPSKIWDSLVIEKKFYCGTTHGVFETDLNQHTSTHKSEKITKDIYVSRLFSKENKLYVVSRSQRIYQYQTTPSLTYLKTLHTPRHACQAIDVQGQYAFIASGPFGMLVVDLKHQSKEVAKLTSLSINSPLGQPYFFYNYDTYIGLVERKKVHIVHRELPKYSYKLINTIDLNESITAIHQQKNKLYVAVRKSGIYAIDLENKNNQENKLYLPCEIPIKSLSTYGEYMYICTENGDVLITETQKDSSVSIKKETYLKNAKLIEFYKNFAFVINEIEDINIYRLENGENEFIGSIEYPKRLNQKRTIHKIYTKNKTLFICSYHGIISIDITNIYQPKTLDSIEFTSYCSSIQFKEDYAYINHNMNYFTLVDISNPNDLKKLCQLYYPTKNWVLEDKLFQINKSGDLTVENAPIILTPIGMNNKKRKFTFPEMSNIQAYDLYISDDQKITKISNALHYNPRTGWQLATKKTTLQTESNL